MYFVSNDPAWWPAIYFGQVFSFGAVATLAAIIYDYALQFSNEVELIWMKPWSLTCALYITVRYGGLTIVILQTLLDSSIPLTDTNCLRIEIAYEVICYIVTLAMQGVIVLRVFAMYGRSKKALALLGIFFSVSQIVSLAMLIVQYGPNSGVYGLEQILSGVYSCVTPVPNGLWGLAVATSAQLTFEVVAVAMVLWCFVVHTRDMRRQFLTTRLDDYINILVKDNVVYFVCILASDCLNAGAFSPLFEDYDAGAAAYNVIYSALWDFQVCIIVPYMVLNIRARHEEKIGENSEQLPMETMQFEAQQVNSGSRVMVSFGSV